MLLPAEKENGHVNPSRITMLLSRLQFGAKMNVLMGLMLLLSLGGALFNALSAQGESMSVHFSLAAVIPATMTCSR